MRPLKVFLCHGKEDKSAVGLLHAQLQTTGVHPWLDEVDLLPGQDWDWEIRNAVRASDVIVVCLSKTSMTKEGYMQKEIRVALDVAEEKPEGTIFIIPLKLEECEVPLRLRRWQWVNFFEDEGWEKLQRSLHGRAEQLGISLSPVGVSLMPKIPLTKINPVDGAEMIWIPAGEFLMGSNEEEIDALLKANVRWDWEWFEDEMPQRRVYLDGYWIYKYPVTGGQYRQFGSETGHEVPTGLLWGEQDTYPMAHVSWEDTLIYCEWAKVRLPTEAEWEKAARGTDGRRYPWGNEWDIRTCVHLVSGKHPRAAAVGSRPRGASPYGVMVMAGNVWEWCSDWYEEGYYKKAPSRNPTGPEIGESRIMRGGSYANDSPRFFRTAMRSRAKPDQGFDNVGFRCASSENPPVDVKE